MAYHFINDEELRKARAWVYEEHTCTVESKYSGASGGRMSLIITPSSLGEYIHVKCNLCKQEKDLTDCSNW